MFEGRTTTKKKTPFQIPWKNKHLYKGLFIAYLRLSPSQKRTKYILCEKNKKENNQK